MTRPDIRAAEDDLRRVEPGFGPLIDVHGPCPLRPTRRGTHFEALVRSVVFQQLAGRAATAIHGRVVALFPDGLTPEAVLAVPDDRLRQAGLSSAKAATIHDLAAHAADGSLPLRRIAALDDDEIVATLSAVRGIGPWTAHMFLMFRLGRLDVWPSGDYGVRKGYAALHGLADLPLPRQMEALGERFAPWRSVAAWYCWRAVDTVVPG